MRTIDLDSLEIFRTVVSEGGVIRAAGKLNRVQSNVTTRIRQLEERLGHRLFLRQGRSEGLLTPPAVGTFAATVDSDTALASTVAGWLEDNGGPFCLAPPLLSDGGGRPRLAELARPWPLAPAVPCRLD